MSQLAQANRPELKFVKIAESQLSIANVISKLEGIQPQHFMKGEKIVAFQQGRPVLGYLSEGFVKSRGAVIAGGTGEPDRRRAIWIYSQSKWFGYEALTNERNSHEYVACSDCTVYLLDLNWVRQQMPRDLLLQALSHAGDMHQAKTAMQLSVNEPLEKKVYCLLALLYINSPVPEIPVTLLDMADIIGSTKSRISAVMKDLARRGFVERRYGEFVVTQPKEILRLYSS